MAEFSKVCFLFETPPVTSYFSRYDMGRFIDEGMQVEVWDLSYVLHPGMYDNSNSDKFLQNREGLTVQKINAKEEFLDCLKCSEGAFFWLTFPFAFFTKWYIRKVAKYRYGFICNVDYVPIAFSSKHRDGYWTNWSVERIRNAVLARIPRCFLGFHLADGVITYSESLKKKMLRNTTFGRKTLVELTNTIDYCEYVKASKSDDRNLDLGRYLVFLDQYLPYHPDGRESGYYLEADTYYSEVRRFIDEIAEITGLDVVVAAHPKADYDTHFECFPNYRVIQFRSAELVRNADLVLSHQSLSLNYVVCAQKPLIVFYTDGMIKNKGQEEQISTVCNSINRNAVNISKRTDNLKEIVYEELNEGYSKYGEVSKYVKLPQHHPNSKLFFGEVMLKVMKRL